MDAGRKAIGDILDAGAAWLESRRVEDARLQCEWLAAALLALSRSELALARGREATEDFTARMRAGVRRLAQGEPVQYVIGEWDFRCLTLATDARALIPRPETEQLVQLALDERDVWEKPEPRLCDVGTGTGCIALSFAVERPQCRCTAVDVDEAALSLARENAVRCGVADRVEFRLGRNCDGAAEASLDAVVSNPPYIASRVVDGLPPLIRDHEPRRALDGGADGLDIVREVVNDAAIALRPGGWCFLEIGDEQGEAVRGILEDAGFSRIAVLSDFAGLTRFAKGRIV
ncbi:MAG: peptide chain release factor N(5)-glutamine methyltransferase [Kiritimatiellae bacterium]|nr:peptide chain release factor N(5)-glutamine methyltransferase [Kiritimatiellia bacterium]